MLINFGRMKKIAITTAPPVADLIRVALDMDAVWDPVYGEKEAIVARRQHGRPVSERWFLVWGAGAFLTRHSKCMTPNCID